MRELGDHPGPVVMLAINQMNVIRVFVHVWVWVWVWVWVRVWCVGVVCTSGCVHMFWVWVRVLCARLGVCICCGGMHALVCCGCECLWNDG